MALAELTTLLATSGGRQADRRGTAESDQFQGLSLTGDNVAFDDELQAILVPFANGSISAEASTITIDSAATEPLSDLALLDTIDQPESDNSPAGSHFLLAFASALPVPAEPLATLTNQLGIQTAAAAPQRVGELSSSVKTITLPAESNAGSSNSVADDVTELPSTEQAAAGVLDVLETRDGSGEQAAAGVLDVLETPDGSGEQAAADVLDVLETPDGSGEQAAADVLDVLETRDGSGEQAAADVLDVLETPDGSGEQAAADVLDVLETPDGSGEQAAKSPALPQSASAESASPASESQTQSQLRLSPHIELTSQEQFTPDNLWDVPDQPDTGTVPQAVAGGPNPTTNPAAAMLMPASSVHDFGSSVDVSLVDAPNLAEQIAAEAVKHAEVVKHQGQQRFTMRLAPPELGKLIVEMQRTEHGLTMRVNAADPVTLGLIQSSLEELNASLGRQDSVFQEVNIDVSTGGEFQQSFADRSSQQALGKSQSRMSSDPPATSPPDNQQNVDFVA